jgi:hypothetical protein
MRCRLGGFALAALSTVALLTACGGGASTAGSAGSLPTSAPVTSSSGASDQQNACPVDGCRVDITSVQRVGKQVRLTWKTNFKPDFSKNHVHVFWNIYTADQVSNDAKSRGVIQGEWVPTDDYPAYVTGGSVSTAKRGKSTTVCVTTGDRLHNVIDASIVDCRDVAKQL